MIPIAFTENLSREKWLEMRKMGIGGSEISAIMNENPWSSPLQVYLDKLGLSEPIEETDQMLFGRLLEPIVAQTFSERTGLKVKELKFFLTHDHHPFLIANVDRVIDHPEWGRGILECKTTNAFKLADWQDGRIPKHYFYQVQHYLGITGYGYAYIACLIGGNTFRYARIERDQAFIDYLQQVAAEFWYNHIIPKVPPAVSYGDSRALSGLYPQHEEGEIYDLHEHEYPLIEDLLITRKNFKQAEQDKQLAENRIKERMAFNESVHFRGEKLISWKTNKKQVRVFSVHCEAD